MTSSVSKAVPNGARVVSGPYLKVEKSMRSKRIARGWATALGALAMGVLLSGRAQAQFEPFFGNIGPFLNKEDFTFADAAARKLLEPQPAAMGSTAPWENPISGNSGLLTMGRAYQRDGNECRTVSWHDVFKIGPARTVMLDTCHIAGVWKLM